VERLITLAMCKRYMISIAQSQITFFCFAAAAAAAVAAAAGGVRGGWDNLLAIIPGGSSVPLLPKNVSVYN
jgi:NADH:ubiquinone oxidoreductase subunit F (NADH-binding)